jgi:hypothetical protein
LGAQFGLNWEYWNFKTPNLIFTKLIDWNQGQNHKKIKVLGQLVVKLKKIATKDQSGKTPNYGSLIDKNRGWNWRNWKFNGQLGVKVHKSKTKDQSAKAT